MSFFTNWLKKEQGVVDSVGLDAAKKRVLGEEEVPKTYIKRGTNPQIQGQPDLNQTIDSVRNDKSLDLTSNRNPQPIESPLDKANERDYTDDMKEGINSEIKSVRDQASPLMDRVQGLMDERDGIIEERQAPVRDYLSNLRNEQWKSTDPEKKFEMASMRANAALTAANAETFAGKQRQGIKAELSYDEVQQMANNAERLKSELGDGGRESIERFVASRKIHDHPIELVRKIRKSLPPELQKMLSSTSGLYSKSDQDYFNPETGEVETVDASKKHFGGFNPDGSQKKRGGQNTQERLDWLLKTALDQGMISPLSGLPMDWDFMELDHAIDKMNPEDEGQSLPSLGSWEYRDHPDNWLWTSTSENKTKLTDSYSQLVDKAVEKKDEPRENFYDRSQLLGQVKDYSSALESQIRTLLFPDFEPGELGRRVGQKPARNFGENVTEEIVDQLFNNEGDILKSIEEGGGSAKSRVAKELMRTMGLKTDQTQVTAGRPDGSTPDDNQHIIPQELFRPLINMFVGQTPERQEEIRKTWIQSGIDANNETLGLAMNSIEDLTGMTDDPRVELLPRDSRKKKKGELNRLGSFKNILLRRLHESGLINVSDMRKYQKSQRATDPTSTLIKSLTRMTGLSEEDLLK